MGQIHTTREQREALAIVRTRVAEAGYTIVNVERDVRRHYLDFAAVPSPVLVNYNPQQFVIIGPGHGRSIELRHYAHTREYPALVALTNRIQIPVAIFWSKDMLPQLGPKGRWYDYIDPRGRKELTQLNGIVFED